jgi:hypothetical protein
MADKHLTELSWKAIAKKQNVTDGALGRALAKYGQLKEDDADGRLKALDEVKKQTASLKADQKKNKEVTDYLDEVLKETDKTRQALEKARPAQEDQDEGEDDDTGGDLAAALAKVKAGQELQFAASVGRPYVVGLAKRIGGKHKRDLKAKNNGSGFLVGSCVYEANHHTFVVDRVQGGLARKLKGGLQAQTNQSYKVRVRGRDDGQVLDDENDVDTDQAGDAVVVEADRYRQRRQALEPLYRQTVDAGPPNARVLQSALAYADKCAQAGDYGKATQGLDALEKLLRQPAAPAAAAPGRAKVGWQVARVDATNQLQKLAAAAAKTKHPLAGGVAVRLMNIVQELKREMNTRGDIAAMTTYLNTSPDVNDVEAFKADGLGCNFRPHLFQALKALAPELPA